MPPTLHFRGPRSGCPSDPIAGSEPRALDVSRALKLSAAFGGANAVVAYAYGDGRAALRARAGARRRHGWRRGGTARRASAPERPRAHGQAQRRRVPRGRPRRARRGRASSRSLRALAHRGRCARALARARRDAMDRTGLFVAATRMPEQSSRRCIDSITPAWNRRNLGVGVRAHVGQRSERARARRRSAFSVRRRRSRSATGSGSSRSCSPRSGSRGARTRASIVAGGVDEHTGRVPDEAEGAACLALERSTIAEPGRSSSARGRSPAASTKRPIARWRVAPPSTASSIDGDPRALKKWLAPNAKLGVDRRRAFVGRSGGHAIVRDGRRRSRAPRSGTRRLDPSRRRARRIERGSGDRTEGTDERRPRRHRALSRASRADARRGEAPPREHHQLRGRPERHRSRRGPLRHGLGLDSLDAVEVLIGLEIDLGIKLEGDDPMQLGLRSVNGVVDVVMRARGELP